MTFTVLGRDPASGALGIGIATYSLAVGATCPRIMPGVGVVTSQASTNPAIGDELMELLLSGTDDPASALDRAVANDEHPEFRQVALLTRDGRTFVHSGENTKPFSGYVNGENCVAVGNFLTGANVLAAMVQAFETDRASESLAEKLLSALEAGKKTGGQSGPNRTHLAERSACLMIATSGEKFPIDIRVDFSTDAIPALRDAFVAYDVMHTYYLARAEDPTNLPSQYDVVKRLNSN